MLRKNFEFLCLYGFRHISKVIHISSSVVWGIHHRGLFERVYNVIEGIGGSKKAQIGAVKNL